MTWLHRWVLIASGITGYSGLLQAGGFESNEVLGPKGGLDSKGVLEADLVPSPRGWNLGGGYRALTNFEAAFSGITGGNGNPQAGIGGQYQDGFVLPDISGSDQLTTNWAYERDSQYDAANGGSLAFTVAREFTTGSSSLAEDVGQGFEIFGGRKMGILGRDERLTWGLQLGLHYSDLEAKSRKRLRGDVSRTIDRYELDGVIPPLAPYRGSFEGPGPLLAIPGSRNSVVTPGGVIVGGSREIDADLFIVNFGPWIEWEVSDHLSIRAEAGLSLGFASGTARYNATANFPGGAATSSDRGSDDDLLLGFYLGVGAVVPVNDDWALQVDLRYQFLDDFSIDAGSSKARLSFDEAIVFGFGARYQF